MENVFAARHHSEFLANLIVCVAYCTDAAFLFPLVLHHQLLVIICIAIVLAVVCKPRAKRVAVLAECLIRVGHVRRAPRLCSLQVRIVVPSLAQLCG